MRATCPAHPIFLDFIALILAYLAKRANYESPDFAYKFLELSTNYGIQQT
jgi:hypothetical protein